MTTPPQTGQELSPWWKIGVIFTIFVGFSVLIFIAVKAYKDAPPIPLKVVNAGGETIFTREDIQAGQQVFLKYALMENGTIWGHGAYLGPDFSAAYLHTLALEAGETEARQVYGRSLKELDGAQRDAVEGAVQRLLRENRYNSHTGTLVYSLPEIASFRRQMGEWADYFAHPEKNGGLKTKYIDNPQELRELTAFLAWTAWASVARRPGRDYSYTSNFPYDPLAGNTPPAAAYLWSALSLVTLLGGTAAILFVFGKFDYLGWRETGAPAHPQMLPGRPSAAQKATIKFFVSGPGAGGGGHGPQPGGAGEFLRPQPLPVVPQQYLAHLALAVGHFLDRHRLRGRRPGSGFLPGRDRTQGAGPGHPHPLLGPGGGGGRQPPGRDPGHQPTPGPPLVLVRTPGLGISGSGTRLADFAGGGAGVVGRALIPGPGAGLPEP
jgi:hypothetical protein